AASSRSGAASTARQAAAPIRPEAPSTATRVGRDGAFGVMVLLEGGRCGVRWTMCGRGRSTAGRSAQKRRDGPDGGQVLRRRSRAPSALGAHLDPGAEGVGEPGGEGADIA